METISGYRFRFDIEQSSFKTAIKQMREQLRFLKSDTNASFKEMQSAGNTTEAYSEKAKKLAQQLKVEKEILQQSREQVKELTNSFNRQEDTLKKESEALSSVGTKLRSEKERLEQVKESLGTNSSAYKKLKSNVEGLESSYKSQVTVVSKANSKYENTRKYLNQATTQVTRTRKEIASLTAQEQKANEKAELYKTGITQVKAAIKRTREETSSYVDKLKSEGNVYSAQKAKLSGLKKEHTLLDEQLTKEKTLLSSLNARFGSSSDKVQEQRTRINKLTTAYNKQASEMRSLNSRYGKMSTGMTKVRDTASKTASKISSTFSRYRNAILTVTAATAGLGAATVSGTKKASDLQTTYKTVTNVLVKGGESAKSTAKQVAKMQSDATKYSVKYGKSQSSIAEAYLDLVKRGHTAKEAVAVMKSELQASVATGDKFSDVVSVSSQVIESFGMKTNNTAKMTANTKKVVNELAYTADMTATDFHSLGKGMEYVGSIAKTTGVSLSSTSVMLGVLSNRGLEADKAGTGVRKVLTSLSSNASALKKYGIQVKNSNGNLKSMSNIFTQINDKTKNWGTVKKNAFFKAIFGTTGMNAASILSENATQLGNLTKKVSAAGEKGTYVASLAKANMKTAKNAYAQFKQAGQALVTLLGKNLLPALYKSSKELTKTFYNTQTMAGLKQLGKAVGSLANKIADLFGYLAKHSSALAGIVNNLCTITGLIAKGAWSVFAGTLKTIGKMFGVVHKNGKNSSGVLEDINGILGKIAKHQTALKAVGGVLITYFASKKLLKFATSLKSKWSGLFDLFKSSKSKVAVTATEETAAINTETGAVKRLTAALKEKETVGSSSSVTSEVEDTVSTTSTSGGSSSTWSKAEKETAKTAKNVKKAETATEGVVTKTGRWSKLLTASRSVVSKVGSVALKAVNVVALAAEGIDLGKNIYTSLTSSNTKTKTKAGAKSIGTVLGGGIGAALGSVVPGLGTTAGLALGASIGNALGGSKTTSKLISASKKSIDKLNKYNKTHTIKTVVKADGTTETVTKLTKAAKKAKELQKTFNSLPKSVQSSVKKANASFKTINKSRLKLSVSYDKTSFNSAKKSIISSVNSLYKQVKSSSAKQAKSQLAQAKKMYKNGLISKSDLAKTEKLVKSHYSKTTKSAKSAASSIKKITKQETKQLETETSNRNKAINKVESKYSGKRSSMATEEKSNIAKIKRGQTVTLDGIEYSGQKGINKIQKAYKAKREKLSKDEGKEINSTSRSYSKKRQSIISEYAKKYADKESDLAKTISKTMTNSSKDQKAIMSKLKSSKGKISTQMADKLISESYRTAKKSIKQAEDDYDSEKKTASKKRDDIIAFAKKTYTGNSDYAVKMRKKLTDEANTQYKNSVSAAKQTKEKTESQISAQEKSVVKTAKSQSKGVTTHMVKQGNNTIEAAGKGASGSSNIFSGFIKWLSKIKWLTGVSGSTAKYNATMTKVGGMTYAKGTGNGTVGKTGTALVGEEGTELAYSPTRGTMRLLGTQGAEVTQVYSDEHILNAKDSAKVLNGGYGEGKVLPGFASGTDTLSSFVKSLTKNASKIYKSLSKTVKSAISHPIKTVEKMLSGMTSIKVPNKGWVKSSTWNKAYNNVGKSVIKNAEKIFKKLASAINGGSSGNANNPTGSGVTRWKPVIKKVAANMNVDLTSSGMSAVLSRIKQESNGSATVENDWDSNAKAGTPSIGLLQYIQPTFKSWLPTKAGHKYPNNIRHGASQIAAMFNDSSWLSDISVSGGWGPTGHKRYANGGFSNTEKLAHISEGNQLEAIIPMSSQKGSRGYELLGQVATMFASRDKNKLSAASGTSSTSSASDSTITALLQKVVDGLDNLYTAQYDTALTKNDIYKINKSVSKKQTRIKNFATD
ncbi:phage tail tape measure protein [Lactiplantibacillus pentosus]|uniref:phage tail tape measure protein n=1 Tax=Lactiplantibacillus pentosus TaxID=1589 RepID=UPI001C20071F|nr:phage tail tape measure protein [Lactiplantibacillus pentosus]MBU7529946.1 phage tail tape measure protein [Lactiplantibacillus pentosus]